MDSFMQYLKDTRVELSHVSWPTRSQALVYTGLVIGVSVAVALFLGFFDFLFARGINFLIK